MFDRATLGHSRSRGFLFALAAFSVLTSCGRGRSPEAARVPSRIVALAPNLTEIVFAVGAGERLVGVSEYSDFPPEAMRVPRVGGVEMSAEKIASLSPDLVLANGDVGTAGGAAAALAASGVAVLAVPTASLDQVLAAIRTIGGRVGKAGPAEELVRKLDARRNAVRKDAATRRRPRALLLVWPQPPQAAGGGTFLDDLLTEAGAENLLASRPGWPVLSLEWISTAPIDVVVLPDSPGNRSVFDRAFAEGPLSRGTVAAARRVRVDEAVLTRPGPRVFDALETLSKELAR